MNLSKGPFWIIIAAFVILGIVYFAVRKEGVEEPNLAPISSGLGPEANLDIPVIFEDVAPGILFRAERSDWRVYARGERSIVVYDLRVEAMSMQGSPKEIQLRLSLMNEDEKNLREYTLDTLLNHAQPKDVLSFQWRFQDTISDLIKPSKLLVSDMKVSFAEMVDSTANHPKLYYSWAGDKPEQLAFSFEIRDLVLTERATQGEALIELSLATSNIGTVPIEYLELKVEAYSQEDVVLFSTIKNVLGKYDAPMRAHTTRLSQLLIGTKDFKLRFETISYIKITILEADY